MILLSILLETCGNIAWQSGIILIKLQGGVSLKQFIVLLAVLPIMLIFLLQFTYDQCTEYKIAFIQEVVYSAKEDAKQEGYFTDNIRKRIVKDISEGLDIPESYIKVESPEEIRYRYNIGDKRNIRYKISVRIENIMAGGDLMGIEKKDNHYIYVIESYTASEKL